MERFMITRFILAASIGSAILLAQDPPEVEAAKRGQPKDVARFISRVFLCGHWGGEEPYNKARAEQIRKAVKQLKCDQLERDEARLRHKYRNNPSVLKALDASKSF